MTCDQFEVSLSESLPPAGISPYLLALWHDGRGDWAKAHEIVQEIETQAAAWVHAYLHRKEGDHSNARYWYRNADKPFPSSQSLDEEWHCLVEQLL